MSLYVVLNTSFGHEWTAYKTSIIKFSNSFLKKIMTERNINEKMSNLIKLSQIHAKRWIKKTNIVSL